MAVVVDSGECPSCATVRSEGDMDRVLTKWRRAATFHVYETEWLLKILDDVDTHRPWEWYRSGRYRDRNQFLAEEVLVNFEFEQDALPALLEKLRRGEDVRPDLAKAVVTVGEDKALPVDQAVAPRNPHGRKGRPNEEGKESTPNGGRLGGASKRDTADIRRLNRDHPDLADRVRAGEVSLNAAAIEAGFRRHTLQISDADPESVAERIICRFGEAFAVALRDAIDGRIQ